MLYIHPKLLSVEGLAYFMHVSVLCIYIYVTTESPQP